MMFLNNNRILSSIAIIIGSGTFWIVQDGCGQALVDDTPTLTTPPPAEPTCSTISTAAYGKTCTSSNSQCTAQGTINDFEGICSKECKTGDSFTRYEDCSVCTHTTIYGTLCNAMLISDSTTPEFLCLTTSTTNPGGDGVYTCSRKVCGDSFYHTIDCTLSNI